MWVISPQVRSRVETGYYSRGGAAAADIVSAFGRDLALVFNNCQAYNSEQSRIWEHAERLATKAAALVAAARAELGLPAVEADIDEDEDEDGEEDEHAENGQEDAELPRAGAQGEDDDDDDEFEEDEEADDDGDDDFDGK